MEIHLTAYALYSGARTAFSFHDGIELLQLLFGLAAEQEIAEAYFQYLRMNSSR